MGFGSFFEKLKAEKQKKESPEYLKQKLESETLKAKIRKQQTSNQSKGSFGGGRVSFQPNINALFGMPAKPVQQPKQYRTVKVRRLVKSKPVQQPQYRFI